MWKAVAVGGRDARRLLAAMLQRVEPEVGDVGGLRMVPDAEEPALVVELVVVTPCGVSNPAPPRVLESVQLARRRPSPRPTRIDAAARRPSLPIHRHGIADSAINASNSRAALRLAPPPRPATALRRTARSRAARRPAASTSHADPRRRPVTHASASATATPPSEQSCAAVTQPRADRRPHRRLHPPLQLEIERRQRVPPAGRAASRGTRCRRGSPRRARAAPPDRPARLEPLRARRVRVVEQPDHADRPASAGSPAPERSHCRRKRCRRPPAARARGTPRRCPRSPRRTATGSRAVRASRSSGSR